MSATDVRSLSDADLKKLIQEEFKILNGALARKRVLENELRGRHVGLHIKERFEFEDGVFEVVELGQLFPAVKRFDPQAGVFYGQYLYLYGWHDWKAKKPGATPFRAAPKEV